MYILFYVFLGLFKPFFIHDRTLEERQEARWGERRGMASKRPHIRLIRLHLPCLIFASENNVTRIQCITDAQITNLNTWIVWLDQKNKYK